VAKTIYVGNLEWNTTQEELKEFFAPIGAVASADIIKDRETGRSKGFGFVVMENAEKAITEMDGKELRGRALKINEAREKPQSSFRSTPRYDTPRYNNPIRGRTREASHYDGVA
jgi:RNA recognition motif-containing protein